MLKKKRQEEINAALKFKPKIVGIFSLRHPSCLKLTRNAKRWLCHKYIMGMLARVAYLPLRYIRLRSNAQLMTFLSFYLTYFSLNTISVARCSVSQLINGILTRR